MADLLHQVYYGNSIDNYLIVLAVIAIGMVFLGFLKKLLFTVLKKRLKNVSSKLVVLILDVLEQTILPLIYITLIYTSISTLHLNPVLRKNINNIMMVVLVFFAIRIIILISRSLRHD